MLLRINGDNLNIEVMRALTGNYKQIVMSENGIKCYGFNNCGYEAQDILDVGFTSASKVNQDVVFEFLRNDIVTWQTDGESDNFDKIIRKDGKTLKIEKTLLSGEDNEIRKILMVTVMRSLINIIKGDKYLLEFGLADNKLTVVDTFLDEILFQADDLKNINIDSLVSYLLNNTLKHTDIKINYLTNKPVSVEIVVFNTKIKIVGDKNLQPILIKCANYKEKLKKINYHQLKMKGF